MRKNETNNLRRHVNIFNLRDVMAQHIQNNSTSGYEHIRYSPINMFMLELVSKIFFLAQVSYVSNYEYGRMYEPPNEPHGSPQTWTMFDYGVLIQLIATLLRELESMKALPNQKNQIFIGVLPSLSGWLVLFYRHFFTNVWNFVDLTGIVLVAIWAVTKNYDDRNYEILARGSLACAAIPQAFGILRYASIEKEMGNLVITVVSMSRDLYSFLVVLIICMFGFGVTLRSLFQHDHANREDEDFSCVSLIEGFSTMTSTQVTLMGCPTRPARLQSN